MALNDANAPTSRWRSTAILVALREANIQLGVAIHGAAQELPYDLSTIRGNLYSQIWRHEVNFVDGYSDLSDTARICAA